MKSTDDLKGRLEENPNLFLLYVQWACGHLSLIDDCHKRLCSASNLNLTGAVIALQTERDKLVKEQAEYKVADRILKGIRDRKNNFRVEAA